MFQMFGVKGAACPRCERKNGGDARYCAGCGLILGAPRNAPLLRENRWVAGPDELAVFFGVRELSGVFVKTLRVPATARAFILQGDKATEVPQGEYEIEGFFTRLNHLQLAQTAAQRQQAQSRGPAHQEGPPQEGSLPLIDVREIDRRFAAHRKRTSPSSKCSIIQAATGNRARVGTICQNRASRLGALPAARLTIM